MSDFFPSQNIYTAAQKHERHQKERTMESFSPNCLAQSIKKCLQVSKRMLLPVALSATWCSQAETYNLGFSRNNLPTFSTPLSGQGNFQLFNFNESFQVGVIKNLSKQVNLGFTKPTIKLGKYGFEASGYVNGNASLHYDYNLGRHSYDLEIPMNVDLNVSDIDANNQITITSSYSLGAQSAILPTVDTNNAFFNIDPRLSIHAGLSATGCVVKCTTLINQNIAFNAVQRNLIDVRAEDFQTQFTRDSSKAEVGKVLTGLFGVDTGSTNPAIIGKFARDFGLLELDIHAPGLDFMTTSNRAFQHGDDQSFTLATTGKDTFFSLGIDVVDAGASAFLKGSGKTLTKLFEKEVSASIGGQKLTAGWELIDSEVTASASVNQNFRFNGTPSINLALSDGRSIDMLAGESITVQLADGVDRVDIDPTFGLSGAFSNKVGLGVRADVDVELLGYNFDLPLGDIQLKIRKFKKNFNFGKLKNFGVNGISTSKEPKIIRKTAVANTSLFTETRQINGFSNVTGNTITSVLPNIEGLGTHGNDILRGTFGHDELRGLGGNDILIGGQGNDTLNGGAGVDTADYRSYKDNGVDYLKTGTQGVAVDLAAGTATSRQDNDTLIDIENVSGSGLNDIIYGNDNRNTLIGRNGDDTLYGRGGNDYLNGGNGVDYLYGGKGNDLISGGERGDSLHGGEGNDVIRGDAGDDNMFGNAGNDRFVMSTFGFANDRIDGGDGEDTVAFNINPNGRAAENVGVWVNLQTNEAKLYKNNKPKQDKVTSITAVENIIGTAYNDILIGDNGNNVIKGGAGYDELNGRGGNDRLVFSAGDDLYSGGQGIDTVDARNYVEAVNVNLATNKYQSIENVIGSRFGDKISGDNANNRLEGGLGSDRLAGQAGDDVLIVNNAGSSDINTVIGGTGVDTVLLTQAVDQNDLVAAYNQGNLQLTLNGGNTLIAEGQYSRPNKGTEFFRNTTAEDKTDISGSFERLVSTGAFNQYAVQSHFVTTENMTVSSQLTNQAKFTNNHVLTIDTEAVLVNEGTLENNNRLVNKGTLIINDVFENHGTFINTESGRANFLADSRISGEVINDGILAVSDDHSLTITGEYYGSGLLAGAIEFSQASLHIGNSPGITNLFGSATFNDVDFNLEVGLDDFGNVEYDIFNVFGDLTLTSVMTSSLFLLDGLNFEDLLGVEFDFLNVTGNVFDKFDVMLSLDDLLDYKVEITQGFFAKWRFEDDLGYSLSFNGTDLFIANGGVLPSFDVPEPRGLLIIMIAGIAFIRLSKQRVNS